MRAHIVLSHPEPQSFNAQLASRSRQTLFDAGWEISFSDLYAMDFDPRESSVHYPQRKDPQVFHAQTEQRHGAQHGALPDQVEYEIQNLMACDLVIAHFPLWWFGMPAMLKGWMDRVFVYGQMYRSEVRYDRGVCTGKRALVCVTTGASRESCAPNGREGDTQMHLAFMSDIASDRSTVI
ncbi:MAG: NAD(P)H-dependent oxidoreductase [Pseudomonadota bacterium]